jgi:CubicO group peptidase (beta-lactamase class C family)
MKIHIAVIVVLETLAIGQSFGDQDSLEGEPRGLYFPPRQGPWEQIEPSAVGWNSEKLEAALEFAGQRNSSSVVVLYRGRILIERHWDLKPKAKLPNGQRNRYYYMVHGKNSKGHVIEDVASVQKSVVSVLAGIAQHKGLLKVSDPVHKYLGEGWSKAAPDEEARITLRHLLTMTSGLDDGLEYEAPAGTKWRYNTSAYSHILRAISVAAQMEPDELTRKWITGPIGMDDSRWVVRPWAKESQAANTVGFVTTAQDLARFGLLILAEGIWMDQAVIEDKEYLRTALQPSQDMNPSYGYLWWLNGQPSVSRGSGERRVEGPLIPNAPSDLVAALGALGRKVYVVPTQELVVTRLGASPEVANQVSFEAEFWKRLMAAAPKD